MSGDDRLDEGNGAGLFSHLPAMLWQRRWLVILPALLVIIGATATALLMKPLYRSQAIVVVESQQLPLELVNSSLTNVIDQRIAKVRQQVLSRPDLIALIQRYNLYPDERQSEPLSKVIEQMREATIVEAIGADIEARARPGTSNTIAFAIGFEYPDAPTAQLIAQEFVTRFLDRDAAVKTEQAVGTAEFLGEQGETLRSQIAEVEARITQIKAQNAGVLTENMMGLPPMLDSGRIDAEINAITRDNNRLLAQQRTGGGGGTEVAQAEQRLRELSAIYSEDHPDVMRAKRSLEAARASRVPGAITPEEAEISANRARIAALMREKASLSSMDAASRAARARAPVVLEEINQLEKQAEGLRLQYQQLGGKLMTAQVSARMESEQKGERLTVADPPVVPDSPLRPNRPLLIAGGVVGGIALGVALALALELLRRPIRGSDALRGLVGVPPLVVIPTLNAKPSFAERLVKRISVRFSSRRKPMRRLIPTSAE